MENIKCIFFDIGYTKQGFGGMQNPRSDEYFPDAEIANLNELLSIL